MIPVLLVICSLHRILAFSNLSMKSIEFDFSDTIQKLRDGQSGMGEDFKRYDLMQDRE